MRTATIILALAVLLFCASAYADCNQPGGCMSVYPFDRSPPLGLGSSPQPEDDGVCHAAFPPYEILNCDHKGCMGTCVDIHPHDTMQNLAGWIAKNCSVEKQPKDCGIAIETAKIWEGEQTSRTKQ
jgi:hypothetical protein